MTSVARGSVRGPAASAAVALPSAPPLAASSGDTVTRICGAARQRAMLQAGRRRVCGWGRGQGVRHRHASMQAEAAAGRALMQQLPAKLPEDSRIGGVAAVTSVGHEVPPHLLPAWHDSWRASSVMVGGTHVCQAGSLALG